MVGFAFFGWLFTEKSGKVEFFFLGKNARTAQEMSKFF